jgi:dsDNA-binding SOS-regulon protein
MGKRKRTWASKEERDAWEAHVDETLARLKALAEKALAELEAAKRGESSTPDFGS